MTQFYDQINEQEEGTYCVDCGVLCSADDAIADDSGLAWCGSLRGNGCAEKHLRETQKRPSLNYEVPYHGNLRTYQITFGYFEGQPTAAVVSDDGVVLIPREVLALIYEQGW